MNPFCIEFTDEDFHRLQQEWGVNDLQHDSADADASPAGSGKIGGSMYTPESDEPRVSDKRAMAVGFGCTYVTGGSSVVMISDVGEERSVDGGAGSSRMGAGGGIGGGDGGCDLGVRQELAVRDGGGGRPFDPALPSYTPPEETSNERTSSRRTTGMPEGTPEVTSTVRLLRVELPTRGDTMQRCVLVHRAAYLSNCVVFWVARKSFC